MTLLYIHCTNSVFAARDEGGEYEAPEHALAIGVKGAMVIAADEIEQGKTGAAVEVCVQQADGKPVLRSVVAVSVSPLLTTL